MEFSQFDHRMVDVGPLRLSVRRAGRGRPLVLLHGYPQNSLCWSQVAPALAERFDVIVPDLRGYGASDAPVDDPAHETYSKRRMGDDIAGLLDALGIEAACVLGHDRGARAAYRMALDHPARVRRLGLVEIVPTGDFWDAWSAELAMTAYHWTFLAQPAPLPERMIGADPSGYVDWTLSHWSGSGDLSAFAPDALAAYRAQMSDPARRAAMCADYRAGAGIDRRLDREDRAAGRMLGMPVFYLYGAEGMPAKTGDPEGIWRSWAPDLTSASCISGHFVMEENPEAVLRSFVPFFSV
ncbi:alpha/beta hydrolase [Profundibacterium mesophilum]|uniref:Haloacetate dehalogenase n=1 Tax=Profundibacterium mesophilum KAUST100406-0324 TaxID=1037889 RepID=A0A921NRP7_9RHOB|nr:alpha/beta hydrolase [Profundibacterium mesophilum]KAF0676565.1 haloacetate dehalogenase [Profundibacterium mesophilum KAUST100406-0324]